MMLVASATAFAGDSDALKAVKKAKTYADAVALLQPAQLANDEERAEAYNKLVDLALEKVSKETGIIAQNQAAVQLGTGKEEAYDTLGLAESICNAIAASIECNKYDQMPNAKGKIKPEYADKNPQRIWAVRSHLVNIGQDQASAGNKTAALKYWGSFVDAGTDPLFDAQNHETEKEYFGQVALFSGRYAYEAKDFDRGDRYIAIARKDASQEKDALATLLYYTRTGLTNHADSVAATNRLRKLYEAEPENDAILDALFSMLDGAKDRAAQTALLDSHLAKFPNSFAGLANKGLMAMAENNAEQGAEWLRKAAAAKPDNAVIYTYLGICLSSLAATTEDTAKSKDYYKQAIDAFDKAKEYDPDKRMANWGYNRYQAYYGLYGEDDPRTKAAEADR